MDRIKTAANVVILLCLFISFSFAGLLINAIQLVLWLTVKPCSRRLYRKINAYLLHALWTQVLILMDWSGSMCSIYTDDETWFKLGHENALLIMNHSNELDWFVGWVLADQVNILGNAKLFIKKAVEWIPIIGWAWKFGEIGFLERNWEKDKSTMDSFVQNIKEYADPVWLLFFPEGTRFTAEKHAVSMDFAAKAGLPHLKHLLVPRTKGFYAITQQLRGKFDAVYSATLCFNTKLGAFPSLANVFLGKPVFGEVFLERIPFEDIPTDVNESSEWLLRSFIHRDKLMDTYEKEGVFPLQSSEGGYFKGPVRSHCRPRSIWPSILFAFWFTFTFPLIWNTVFTGLGTGMSGIIAGLAIVGAVGLFMLKLIDITMISRGSSYGCKTEEKSR